MTLEEKAEAFVSEKADKGNFDVEKFGKAYFSESSMKQALVKFAEPREKRIAELEKENKQLRNNGFTVSAMTEQQLKVAIEKGEQLEKEKCELLGIIQEKDKVIEKMKLCANCSKWLYCKSELPTEVCKDWKME